MNDPDGKLACETLIAYIDKHQRLLAECLAQLQTARTEDISLLGRTPRAAVMLAGLIENYYTCGETLFVRISQFFENNLPAERWHRELLERMTLEIGSARPRVISDESFNDLLEVMRFRHFKRYYFGTSYDWARVDALLSRIDRLADRLPEELGAFKVFLQKIVDI